MRCGACGVAIPDGRITFRGVPICMKCTLKGFGIKQSPVKIVDNKNIMEDQK